MTRRTKKVGNAGRYGARYGVRIRKQINSIGISKNKVYECPRCMHEAVRRVETGVVVADFDEYALFPRAIRQPTRQGGEASLRFLDEGAERPSGVRVAAGSRHRILRTLWVDALWPA